MDPTDHPVHRKQHLPLIITSIDEYLGDRSMCDSRSIQHPAPPTPHCLLALFRHLRSIPPAAQHTRSGTPTSAGKGAPSSSSYRRISTGGGEDSRALP